MKRGDSKWAGALLKILAVTLKIGAFTFGGGLAMISVLEHEFVDKHGWLEREELIDVLALSQSLPGVIAVNSSVIAGYRVLGVSGALTAAVGVVFPSLIVVIVVAIFYDQFRDNPWVAAAFKGFAVGVAAVMTTAVIRMGKNVIRGIWSAVFGVVALCLTLFTDASAIVLLLFGALLGYMLNCWGVK